MQVTHLSSNHHSGNDATGLISQPRGVQATTINLQPSQPKSSHVKSMSGAMTATTNYNNSALSNDNMSVHDHNSDKSNHALQATLHLIVNDMGSMQSQLNHVNSVIEEQNASKTSSDQHGLQSDLSQPGVPATGAYDFYVTQNIQHIMTQQRSQGPTCMPSTSLHEVPGPSVSNCVHNSVYDSIRLCNSLANLSSAIPSLCSTVGMTDISTVHTIPGILDKHICQCLQCEYMCLDESLQHYTFNNTEV